MKILETVMQSIHCAVFSVRCAFCSVHYLVCIEHYLVCSVHYVMTNCALLIVPCALFIDDGMLLVHTTRHCENPLNALDFTAAVKSKQGSLNPGFVSASVKPFWSLVSSEN